MTFLVLILVESSSKQTPEEGYANLSINDGDDEGLILEDANEEGPTTNLAVRSFLTSTKINFGAMQDTLAAIWRPVKGVFMEETIIPNLFLFKFFHELDLQRVLDDGLWTFNNQALLIKRLEMGEQLSEIKLKELYMWIQIYDLPIGFNSESILKSMWQLCWEVLNVRPKKFTRHMETVLTY